MTNRDFVSQVRATHRLISSDARINDRTILRQGRLISLPLIKQQTDKKKLWASPNLFTPLPCLEMEEAPLAECCDFVTSQKVARSVHRLPKIAEGITGMMIQRVSALDYSTKITESTPDRYANILKMKLPNRAVFYWIYDDHLWITNPDTRRAQFAALFEDDVPTYLLYPNADCGCEPPTLSKLCENPLDQPFRCPGYLIGTVTDMVSEKLLQTYHRLPQDSTQDNIDDQTQTK